MTKFTIFFFQKVKLKLKDMGNPFDNSKHCFCYYGYCEVTLIGHACGVE